MSLSFCLPVSTSLLSIKPFQPPRRTQLRPYSSESDRRGFHLRRCRAPATSPRRTTSFAFANSPPSACPTTISHPNCVLALPKFQKIFKLELKNGAAEGREQALRKLHTIAMSGKNLAALTFWIKARCGWRDTGTTTSAARVIRHVTVFKPEADKP